MTSDDLEPPDAEFEGIAGELYGLTPAEFTAARNARAQDARQRGDAELAQRIGRLPKPSASAYALNALARARADIVRGLAELGSALREAQGGLDRDALRALGPTRQREIASAAKLARSLAGEADVRLSEPAAVEVSQSLQAALSDPDAAAALGSGLLVRPLAATGWDRVDLEGALAVEGAAPVHVDGAADRRMPVAALRSPPTEDSARRSAEKEAALTSAEADQAAARVEELARALAGLAARRSSLAAERADLESQLRDVGRDITEADREQSTRRHEKHEADRAAAEARRRADRAARRLDASG